MTPHPEPHAQASDPSIHRTYVLDVQILERNGPDGPIYQFEAPNHEGRTFAEAETAELYVDVYFDVNGFDERGVGERGLPPTIVQAGRDTMIAYLFTQSWADLEWIASYYGCKPARIKRYRNRVQQRASQIRSRVADRDVTAEAT
ncbi:MAG: hypothetical protein ABEJ86_06185 [Halococcoides sp.]